MRKASAVAGMIVFLAGMNFPATLHAATLNFAADVTYALISPAASFTVLAGSGADSITVNATSVIVSVPAGQGFTLISASSGIDHAGATSGSIVNVTCDSNQVAILDIPSTNPSPQTLTITPTGAPCMAAAPPVPIAPQIPVMHGGGGALLSPAFKDLSFAVQPGTGAGPQNVVLVSNAPEAQAMLIGVSPDFAQASWMPYAATLAWTLPSSTARTVYIKFRNALGAISGLFHAPIPPPKDAKQAVNSSSTVLRTCTPYLTAYIRYGSTNDPVEVKKLQDFLREKEGESLKESGTYDQATFDAVKRFQKKEHASILDPWHETQPTGHVGKTTVQRINELACNPSGSPPVIPSQPSCPYFVGYAKKGDKGIHVADIQTFLAGQKLLSGIYAAGEFDKPTETAVKKFQAAHAKEILSPLRIASPTGYWLQATLRAANKLVGCK